MPLRELISAATREYPQARTEAFTNHPMGQTFRRDIKKVLAETIRDKTDGDLFTVKGSVGQAAWARVPWVGIFHRLVTESAMRGYYLVYLWRADGSGLYLSLNQGVTTVREEYGSSAIDALRTRGNDFRARLGAALAGFDLGNIDLQASQETDLAAGYEAGNVCSIFYAANEIPADEFLVRDLVRFLELYIALERNLADSAAGAVELNADDVFFEDPSLFRLHRRIERNPRLSAAVKRAQGYTCQACGFSFEKQYREIGAEFIEAHHLRQLSAIKGGRTRLNPVTDFAVLCSNCHRMIHRTDCIGDIAKFSQQYLALSRK